MEQEKPFSFNFDFSVTEEATTEARTATTELGDEKKEEVAFGANQQRDSDDEQPHFEVADDFPYDHAYEKETNFFNQLNKEIDQAHDNVFKEDVKEPKDNGVKLEEQDNNFAFSFDLVSKMDEYTGDDYHAPRVLHKEHSNPYEDMVNLEDSMTAKILRCVLLLLSLF